MDFYLELKEEEESMHLNEKRIDRAEIQRLARDAKLKALEQATLSRAPNAKPEFDTATGAAERVDVEKGEDGFFIEDEEEA